MHGTLTAKNAPEITAIKRQCKQIQNSGQDTTISYSTRPFRYWPCNNKREKTKWKDQKAIISTYQSQ